ncbi:MAG: hypothetical protein MUF81_02655 [Verrucomicrobia bacterium]|jgi:hypothetical protein|nr:hypothetical protein [Verrucomicrobiota bacterium]
MTDPEKQNLRAAYDALLDATQCAAVKLGQPTHTDFFADCDFFDVAPERAILREAKRLRELVAQL